jgi:hypothetical protein
MNVDYEPNSFSLYNFSLIKKYDRISVWTINGVERRRVRGIYRKNNAEDNDQLIWPFGERLTSELQTFV